MVGMERVGAAAVTEPVPPAAKTMPLDRVFWSHFSPNLGPGGWVAGVLLVHLGLDVRTGVAAILLGNVLGALPVAFAAAIGPVTGLPQMESARRVLGDLGVRLPSALNWFYCVGWDAVNNVPAATALVALLLAGGIAVPFAPALVVLASCQMVAGIYGHDMVQAVQKYLGGALLVLFAGIGLATLLQPGATAAPAAPHAATAADIVLAVAIIASFFFYFSSYS